MSLTWDTLEPLTFITSAILSIILFLVKGLREKQERTDEIKVQSAKLQAMIDNLDELKSFVESQRKRIEEEEIIVNQLKNEKEQLKPIVQADKEVVNAIFSIQENRQRKSVWIDRAIGFFIGIFSSIAASYIFQYFQN